MYHGEVLIYSLRFVREEVINGPIWKYCNLYSELHLEERMAKATHNPLQLRAPYFIVFSFCSSQLRARCVLQVIPPPQIVARIAKTPLSGD